MQVRNRQQGLSIIGFLILLAVVGFSELTSLASPSGLPDAPPSELPPTPVCLRRMAEAAWRGARADGQQELFESAEGAAPGAPA